MNPKHGDDLELDGLFFGQNADDLGIDEPFAKPNMRDSELFSQAELQLFFGEDALLDQDGA